MESLQRILNNASVVALIVELCDLGTLCRLLQARRMNSENLEIAFSARALTSRSSQARAAAVLKFEKLETGCEYATFLIMKPLKSKGKLVRLAAVRALTYLAQKKVHNAIKLLTEQFHDTNAAVKLTAAIGLRSTCNDIRAVVVTALKTDGHGLEYVSHDMKGDRELCVAAVTQSWEALKWAREDMKGDKDVLLAAYQQMGLSFTRHDIKNSRSIVKAAVGKKGAALKITSDEMKGDRELCTVAVAQDGLALEFVSHELKGDRDLCMTAIAQNGFALSFVNVKLTDDESFLKALSAIKLACHSHALVLVALPYSNQCNNCSSMCRDPNTGLIRGYHCCKGCNFDMCEICVGTSMRSIGARVEVDWYKDDQWYLGTVTSIPPKSYLNVGWHNPLKSTVSVTFDNDAFGTHVMALELLRPVS